MDWKKNLAAGTLEDSKCLVTRCCSFESTGSVRVNKANTTSYTTNEWKDLNLGRSITSQMAKTFTSRFVAYSANFRVSSNISEHSSQITTSSHTYFRDIPFLSASFERWNSELNSY